MAIEQADLAYEVPMSTEPVSAQDSVADEQAYAKIREILSTARQQVETSVNSTMVTAYWHIGRQISERIGKRAAYGKHLYRYLSERLTSEFGRGFGPSNLNRMRQLYEAFPIFATLSPKLSWSHYLQIMRVETERARKFYISEASTGRWSVRDLKRAIDTRYYERLLRTQQEDALKADDASGEETLELAKANKNALDHPSASPSMLKDPYVFEFLDIGDRREVLESELEDKLIGALHDFLLELGRGFAYVGRQQRVSDGVNDYWIDLVFYNYYLKCFVLIDLKTHPLTAQDVGQMDFYMNLFDDLCKVPGDNPTIGIVMCTSRTETVAKYSAIAHRKNLYAAQYFTYLPTEEELETVLKRNRAEFEEQIARQLPEEDEEI